MDLLTGVIVALGGLWILGRISRFSPNHPVNAIGVQTGQTFAPSPTIDEETANVPGGAMIAGEPLDSTICCHDHPATSPLPGPSQAVPGVGVTSPNRLRPTPIAPRPLPRFPVARPVAVPMQTRFGTVVQPATQQPRILPATFGTPTLRRVFGL